MHYQPIMVHFTLMINNMQVIKCVDIVRDVLMQFKTAALPDQGNAHQQ
jgi:hypothetical protein